MGSRIVAFFKGLPFSPSDWLILGILSLIAVIAAGWLVTSVSYHFTTEAPARGGTYREGIVGIPRFINPVLALSDADRDMTALVFSGLLHANADGSLSPDLAEGYSVSEDKTTYTFTIREGVTFHDGTPVTAADVAFTVALAQNPATKSPKRPNWEGVQVAIVDDRTISFTLKSPYAPFLENATMGILPRHLWEQVSAEEFPFSTLNLAPIGTGPYAVEEVTNTAAGIPAEITLQAFEGAVRVPYISTLVCTFYSDMDALANAVQRDPSIAAHSLISDEALATHHAEEAVLGRVFGIFFNQNQNELFADRVVRAALDESLDKRSLVDTLVSGYGSPLWGPLPPQSVGAAPAVASSTEDHLESALATLAAGGWTPGEDGVLQKKVGKTTKRLSFTLVTGNAPELKRAAELVAERWQALGAEVTTQFFEQGDLQQEVIRPRKYDALLFGEVVGRDVDLFAFWHSSQRNDPGLNIGLYVNNAVDKKLEEARTIEDPVLRRAAAEEAATTIADEHAAVFLYAPHFVYLVPERLGGLQLGTVSTPADRFVSVTDWYLATERLWPFFVY